MQYCYCVFLIIAGLSLSCQQDDSAPTTPPASTSATQKSVPTSTAPASQPTTCSTKYCFHPPELAAMRTPPTKNDPTPMTDEELDKLRSNALTYLESLDIPKSDFAKLDDSQYIQAIMAIGLICYSDIEEVTNAFMSAAANNLNLSAKSRAIVACRYWRRDNNSLDKMKNEICRQLYAEIESGKWQYDDPSLAVEIAFWMTKAISEQHTEIVPNKYWQKLRDGLVKLQNSDGGWGRDGNVSDVAMTAAALWTLQQCRLKLDKDLFDDKLMGANYLAMEKGFAWLDANFQKFIAGKLRGKDSLPACLYYVKKLATVSGLDRIGGVKWFDAGANMLADARNADGLWLDGMSYLPTTYAIAFLQEPRTSMLGHLKYDGNWNNRPLASINLAKYLGPAFCCCPPEGYIARLVDMDTPVNTWPTMQVLIITGDKAYHFTDRQIEKLKLFIERGGAIFVCDETESGEFSKSMTGAFAKIFPNEKPMQIANDDEIWKGQFREIKIRFEIYRISNGVRPVAYLCKKDMILSFQLDERTTKKSYFDVMVNIIRECNEKPFRVPLPWPIERKFTPAATIKAARLKYDGFIDREPQAWERFRLTLARCCKIQADIIGPIEIADLPASGAKIAIFEGVGKFSLTDDQRSALKKFVADGGTLLVDSLGGDETFANDAKSELQKIWGSDAMRQITPDSPMLNIQDFKIEKMRYQRATRQRLDYDSRRRPPLQIIDIGGRSAVFFSREDIAAGLLDCQAATIDGYAPESAYDLARNIFIYGGQIKLPPTSGPAK